MRRLLAVPTAWRVAVLLAAAWTTLPALLVAQESVADAAARAQNSGRYDEALTLYESILSAASGDSSAAMEAEVGYLRTLLTVGRYEDVIAVRKERGGDAESASAELDLLLGRALSATGSSDDAETLLRRRLERGSNLEVRLDLALLLRARGAAEEARQYLYGLIDEYNRRTTLTASELLAIGHACRFLGNENHNLFKDALKAYDQAIAADPSLLEARVATAELFLEKYESPKAREELAPALIANPANPRARMALARILRFDGSPAAMLEVRKALEVNERLGEARVFIAENLLELENYAEAEEEARRALEVNPESLEAQSVLAASFYLRGMRESFAEAERRVLERNPQYADFYNLLGDACVRNRFYKEAVTFSKRAVELDPRSWRGFGLLGLNQLRVGLIDSGRRNLEIAFEGDPYNVWFKNTLDLVDSWQEFESRSSRRFIFVGHRREVDLLAPVALALAEEAYEALAERYQIEPPTPIRIELYESDADFSVRTIGLAGMGALGVCFGEVIAQDSPRARPRGTFNWGSTLWHEIAHSFTLAASGHKVPRWLTEGLSVLEERRARQGWGDDVNRRFLAAWRDDQLLPVAEINNGFVRPKSREQIGLSYMQSSYLCELIERDHGLEALLALLHGYRDGRDAASVFEEVVGSNYEAFDVRFEAYLQERFGAARAAMGEAEAEAEEPSAVAHLESPSLEELAEQAKERPGHFASQMAYGHALFGEERLDDAILVLQRAKRLFPGYVAEGSPYHLLAEIYAKRDDSEGVAAELEGLIAINENEYDGRIELAAVRRKLDDAAGAAEALEGAIFVFPYEASLHRRLADAHAESGNAAGVVRARRALVALHPVDRAQALFDLASSLRDVGAREEARGTVLRALEIAPSFVPAQRLLLELHKEEPPERAPDRSSQHEAFLTQRAENGRMTR